MGKLHGGSPWLVSSPHGCILCQLSKKLHGFIFFFKSSLMLWLNNLNAPMFTCLNFEITCCPQVG